MKVKNQYLKILEYLHLRFNKWPSIHYKFWVSLVLWTTLMEKTADLAMIQKTNIDTLHKEGKSQRCTSHRDDRKLENTVKQSWFKHLWELHKEWTEAGVSASRVTTLRRLQEKRYQDTSEPETTSEASYLGCGEKELDCCSVVQSPLFRWK